MQKLTTSEKDLKATAADDVIEICEAHSVTI